ncbi:MAG: LysR family transcriptional regulator [Alphaproteobacteria bacterium]
MKKTNLRRTDVGLLVVFDAVARTRSATAAATLLALSQPAVSHALARLRTLMGDPLFVRGRDGLVPTPRARGATAEVRAALATLGRVLADGAFDPAAAAREFRLAGSDYAMMTFVPPVVAALRRRAPGSAIGVAPVDAGLPLRLERGEADLAFYALAPPPGPFASQELFREHLVGLVCERHPLARKARRGRLTLDDYLAYPHVVAPLPTVAPGPIDARLAELGRARRIGMATPNFAANMAALHATDLVMSLPSRLAARARGRGLTPFALPFAVPDYPYLMVWHRGADADPASAWLRRLVVETIAGARTPRPRRKAG